MINKISLDNIKIHKHLTLELSNLTILTGKNSSGKSTVCQSLLLLRQSYLSNTANGDLDLNGDQCNFNNAAEAINEDADVTEGISILLVEDEQSKQYCYSIEDTMLYSGLMHPKEGNSSLEGSVIVSSDLHYISADRRGPQTKYSQSEDIVESKRQMSKKYGRCEYAAHFLQHFKNSIKVDERLCLGDKGNELIIQVSEWESRISGDVRVDAEKSDNDIKLTYSYEVKGLKGRTKNYSAVNVGYGLTYVLPIIIALLSTPAGGLVMIENPEAHLHPAGQSALMELVAKAAQAGIQVIIETHSDHIVNGALVQSKLGHVEKSNLTIYFFDR